MRVALVGAFPFPIPQGSQVYVEGQREALQRAGAEPVLLTYPDAISRWSRGRSGPSFAKPFADSTLLRAFLRAHRRAAFDVALAHNAEAAVVAILARAWIGVPVIYVAHTILRHELSAYAPASWRGLLDPIGGGIDAWIARRADGIIALCEDARALLEPYARCPIEIIPPGLDPKPPPAADERRSACRSIGVEPQRFVLYAGNLDGYQDLDLLDAAAGLCSGDGIPFVVATHDTRGGSPRLRSLRIVERSFAETRCLQFAAGSLVLTRRRPGGFPIKLLNYMEAGRPIVAFGRIAPGLEDGVNACLLDESCGADELAGAIRGLWEHRERGEKLGRAARDHLLTHHRWRDLADQTLAFAATLGKDASTRMAGRRDAHSRR
jgi:glycosyltransferase involved in cell wall biosynthesis